MQAVVTVTPARIPELLLGLATVRPVFRGVPRASEGPPVLRVRREHAYLIPQGRRLPFTPRGPVFRVQ